MGSFDVNGLVPLSLAAASLVRLIADDFVFDRPRLWLITRRRSRWLATLLGCRWCLSMWCAVLVVAIADWFGSVTLPGLAVLAVRTGAVLTLGLTDRVFR